MTTNFEKVHNMPTVQKTNYTKEQTTALIAGYEALDTFDARDEYFKANEMSTDKENILAGKTVRSQRSKLVNENVYIKKTAVSAVTGASPAKKEAMAQQLVDLAGVNIDAEGKQTRLNAESVEKMNKLDIQFFITKINDLEKVIAEVFEEDETVG